MEKVKVTIESRNGEEKFEVDSILASMIDENHRGAEIKIFMTGKLGGLNSLSSLAKLTKCVLEETAKLNNLPYEQVKKDFATILILNDLKNEMNKEGSEFLS